jgi:hypothetical protein
MANQSTFATIPWVRWRPGGSTGKHQGLTNLANERMNHDVVVMGLILGLCVRVAVLATLSLYGASK